MTQIEAQFENEIQDNKLLNTFSLLPKLNRFDEAFGNYCKECHNLRLKKELQWVFEKLVGAIAEGVAHGDEPEACLTAMDKAKSYCNLFYEYLAKIWDEVTEKTFDQIYSELIQIKEELSLMADLNCAKIAH